MIKANLALKNEYLSSRVKPVLFLVPIVFLLMAVFFEARANSPKRGVHFFRVSVSPFEPGSVLKKENIQKEMLKIGEKEYAINPEKSSDQIYNHKLKKCLEYQIQNWVALSSDPRLANDLSQKLSFVGIQVVQNQIMGGHDLNLEKR